MTEKVILLDFDGPLSNPLVVLFGGNDLEIDPVTATALNNVCAVANAKVACTSTRTNPYSEKNRVDTLAMLEAAGLEPRHIHEDWSCFYDMESPRSTHIKKWLKAHPEVTHFAVIDDDRVGGKHLIKHLIRVSALDGMQLRHFEKLAQLLDFKLCDVFNHAREIWYANHLRMQQNAAHGMPGFKPA